jgi:Spy/CpxP family protein refolding chaperone
MSKIKTILVAAAIASASLGAMAEDNMKKPAGAQGARMAQGEVSKRNIVLGVLGVAAVAAALDDSGGTTTTVQ